MSLLWQGGWTRWPTDIPSNPYHSVILGAGWLQNRGFCFTSTHLAPLLESHHIAPYGEPSGKSFCFTKHLNSGPKLAVSQDQKAKKGWSRSKLFLLLCDPKVIFVLYRREQVSSCSILLRVFLHPSVAYAAPQGSVGHGTMGAIHLPSSKRTWIHRGITQVRSLMVQKQPKALQNMSKITLLHCISWFLYTQLLKKNLIYELNFKSAFNVTVHHSHICKFGALLKRTYN